MSNTSQPQGLSPTRYLNGAPWTGGGNLYYIASDDSNAYAIGDPLVLSGSGDGNGVPGVTLATAGTGNSVLGALVSAGGLTPGGAYANPTNLNTTVIPATKAQAYYVLVVDDPNVLFVCQEGGGGAALTQADIGSNANLLAAANNGYVSGWTFNNATLAVTNTLQLKLMGLIRSRDNAFGTYAKWLVMINNHSYRAGTTGV